MVACRSRAKKRNRARSNGAAIIVTYARVRAISPAPINVTQVRSGANAPCTSIAAARVRMRRTTARYGTLPSRFASNAVSAASSCSSARFAIRARDLLGLAGKEALAGSFREGAATLPFMGFWIAAMEIPSGAVSPYARLSPLRMP